MERDARKNHHVSLELLELKKVESALYRKKAKVQWLKERDMDTKFFHSTVLVRKKYNTIRLLKDEEENQLETFEKMSYEMVKIFIGLIGTFDATMRCPLKGRLKDLLQYTFPVGVVGDLVKEVISEEIKEALFRQGNDKSPGPDGFTVWMVAPNQSTFIKVRSIVDNTLLAYEVLGLPEVFRGWVKACVITTIFFVLSMGFFKGARGVRHGNPLSPDLFVLIMDFISSLLDVVAHGGIFRFHPKCKRIPLNHLCFIDDLLIFCHGSIDTVIGVISVLDQFHKMSGLRLNVSKTEIYVCGI
ncbi:uncharacterized protein LOC120211291 [Hibiscus syriacus]|uniref:uncharacterized protein LOC120211291 n=1 Tax=Hibiscus syriacus TaxID=106335 RepID=UPI00192296D3|nr:uncharacterized protein LOC120211291 [Hibiscus syriacus]